MACDAHDTVHLVVVDTDLAFVVGVPTTLAQGDHYAVVDFTRAIVPQGPEKTSRMGFMPQDLADQPTEGFFHD